MLKLPNNKTEEDFDAHFQNEIWLEAAKEICQRHHISFSKIRRAGGSEHIVFFVDDSRSRQSATRIF
jgi:hypothetical protein